jgi:hypothetical protein
MKSYFSRPGGNINVFSNKKSSSFFALLVCAKNICAPAGVCDALRLVLCSKNDCIDMAKRKKNKSWLWAKRHNVNISDRREDHVRLLLV